MARGITEADFALLRGNLAGQSTAPASVARKPPQRARTSLPENIVEQQICDFLRVRRWVVKRQHVGKHVPLGFLLRTMEHGGITREAIFRNIVDVGEKYAADWRAERAVDGGLMQVLYVEVKAPGRKPTPEQKEWLERARLAGARAGWWDSIEAFTTWYAREFAQ